MTANGKRIGMNFVLGEQCMHTLPPMNRAASKPIRVAFFHPSLVYGGIQRVFVNLARGFLEHGLAVDMVQATPEGNFRDQVPAGVRLVDLNASRALTSLVPLVRYLRRERPDAIISGATQTNVVAVWAKLLARIPTRLILTEHCAHSAITLNARTFRTRTTPFFVRRFYPWADDLVAVSQGAAKDLASVMRVPAGLIHVIYNPIVGSEFWRRAAEPLADTTFAADPRPAILAVGHLHYHKDFPTLLRAMAIVRHTTNARLVFLGDGEDLWTTGNPSDKWAQGVISQDTRTTVAELCATASRMETRRSEVEGLRQRQRNTSTFSVREG